MNLLKSRLYEKWKKTDEKKKVTSYNGKKLEEIPEEDRELVETIRKFGYGLNSSKKKITEQKVEEAGFGEQDIGKATINIETEKKDMAQKQIQMDLQKMQEIVKNR